MVFPKDKIDSLRELFLDRDEVAFAFIFGSYATGRQTTESDFDIAAYFYPKSTRLEWEEECRYENEDNLWTGVEKIVGIETDFVVLNRAGAVVAYSIISDGIPVIIKDRSLYWRFFLTVGRNAEDFMCFERDFWAIKQRSKSMSEIDRNRLYRILDFLESELADYPQFQHITRKRYLTESSFRRNVERWIENIVNASIDISKILLASNHGHVPATYRESLQNLSLFDGFSNKTAEDLARFSRLRNILAHEYLDIRYREIEAFLKEVDQLYWYLVRYVKKMIE